MRVFTLISAALVLMVVGCAQHREAFTMVEARSLRASVGREVTLTGVAEPRPFGAALRGDGFYVWIDGLVDWPSGWADKRVQVCGVLEERYDLPVFIQKPGELPMQGIPVPEGTDLHEASHRYVVQDAKWRLIP
jgi:hypothetical protein